jgi:putative transposase
MHYGLDLRERVIGFIKEGGSKSEASRRFRVSRQTIYNWLSLPTLAPVKMVHRRKRKLDWEALRQDMLDNPDVLLRERAVKFGVRPNAIFYAVKQMDFSHKKNTAL